MFPRYQGKTVVSFFLVLIFASVALFVFVCPAPASPQKLKAVSAWPRTIFEVKYNLLPALDLIKKRVAQKYPGELEIDYLGGSEVIPFREQVDSLKAGTVDIVFTHTGYYTSLLPVLHLLNLSELKPEEERARGFNKVLSSIHEKQDIHFLGRLGLNLSFGLYLKKPIDKADLKGLRIRVSPTHRKVVENLGGEPAMIPPTDIYVGMQRGLLNGFVWPAGIISEWGWQEQVSYIVKPFFYSGVANVIVMNTKAWNKLPKHLQELLTTTVAEAADEAYEDNAKRRDKELREMHEKGAIKIIDLPQPEAKKLQATAREVMLNIVHETKASEEDIKKLAEVLNISTK